MASDKQIAANRLNALKSTGPTTPEGKARCAENSTRHGMLARSIVLLTESADRFHELLAGFQLEYQPQDATERALVEIMAVSHWRLQRLWNMERAGFDYEYDQQTGDCVAMQAPTRFSLAFRGLGDKSRALDLMNRYETRLDRQFKTTLDRLQRIQHNRSGAKETHSP
ncbi:MAG: hypothetical protein ABSB15_14930 [Bryobacteraceae bacterium]|jgi:hypothetical protein